MLTQKQYNLLMYINKFYRETGQSPSFDEMREAIGLRSKSGIYSMIKSLEERNFIHRLPHKARAMEIVRLPKYKPQAVLDEEKKREEALQNGSVMIPLCGKISIGTPIEDLEDEPAMIPVPFNIVQNGKFYALKIGGDSMIGAGIIDGDIAIIRQQDRSENGKIVVAVIDSHEATLKILRKDEDKVYLFACNRKYKTRVFNSSRVKIQGVLAGIIRKY